MRWFWSFVQILACLMCRFSDSLCVLLSETGSLRFALSSFAVARVLGLEPYQECGARSVNMPRCHSGIQS